MKLNLLYRFKNAVAEADKAHAKDKSNEELSVLRENMRIASAARIKGNKHYSDGEYLKACDEYKVGLQHAKSNVTFLCNLAACHLQLERWKQCIEICNQVLQIRPDNKKALERRAHSYAKVSH